MPHVAPVEGNIARRGAAVTTPQILDENPPPLAYWILNKHDEDHKEGQDSEKGLLQR